MADQLSFDLPVKPALGREDFFVSPANAMAVALIDNWQEWPSRKLMLTGPMGAGKTHLAHVWAGPADATIIRAADLSDTDIPALSRRNIAVEDADAIAGTSAQESLFHLHNLVLAERNSLLLTAKSPPARWGVTLPDLQSRMQGTTSVALEPPDDALLAAVLAKLFTDRQLSPAPDVIPYLVRNIERSFDSAARIVKQLDQASMARRRPLTRRLAVDVLQIDQSE